MTSSEGAVLAIPEGALLRPCEWSHFRDYLEANTWKLYELVHNKYSHGELRLVIGRDKMRAWGIATFQLVGDVTANDEQAQFLSLVPQVLLQAPMLGMIRDCRGKSWPWWRWWHPLVHNQCLLCELWLPLSAMTGRNSCEVAGKLQSSMPRPLLEQPRYVTEKQENWFQQHKVFQATSRSHRGLLGTQSHSMNRASVVAISTKPNSSIS